MGIIKKIWNDPVWSKVISVAIVAIITSIYAVIRSYIDNLSIGQIVKSLFMTHVQLWIIVLIIFIGLILYGIYVKYRKQKKFVYDQHAYENDKELYNSFLMDLTPNGSIYFLRTNNFAGFSFHLSSLGELENFYHKYSDDPRIEFFHPEIEQIRKKMMADIDSFEDLICVYTFPGSRDDLQTVPPEWEENNPNHFWDVVNKIHAAARQVCEDYDNFVKTGKRLIKMDK